MRITWDHVEAARQLAARAHTGQVDKSGRPYIEHPAAVVDRLPGGDPLLLVVGWLHDVVEDTRECEPVTLEEIRAAFGPEVADAVDAITHQVS